MCHCMPTSSGVHFLCAHKISLLNGPNLSFFFKGPPGLPGLTGPQVCLSSKILHINCIVLSSLIIKKVELK